MLCSPRHLKIPNSKTKAGAAPAAGARASFETVNEDDVHGLDEELAAMQLEDEQERKTFQSPQKARPTQLNDIGGIGSDGMSFVKMNARICLCVLSQSLVWGCWCCTELLPLTRETELVINFLLTATFFHNLLKVNVKFSKVRGWQPFACIP